MLEKNETGHANWPQWTQMLNFDHFAIILKWNGENILGPFATVGHIFVSLPLVNAISQVDIDLVSEKVNTW